MKIESRNAAITEQAKKKFRKATTEMQTAVRLAVSIGDVSPEEVSEFSDKLSEAIRSLGEGW